MTNIILGATALGLLWAVMTMGVYMTYRVLDVADLTAEGSIALGGAVAAVIIRSGGGVVLALAAAALSGGLAGLITGLLHTKLKIPALLAGILTMIGLYSVNIRVMGGSANISLLRLSTVFTPLEAALGKNTAALVIGGGICAAVIAALWWFLGSEIGCALRATGCSIPMARAQGIDTDSAKLLGYAIGNGLVGLSGGLIAQYLGYADVQMGTGAIVIGLASLIIGEVLFGRRGGILRALCAAAFGAAAYRIIIAGVLELGMPATDLKLFTAVTVGLCMCLPAIRRELGNKIKVWKEARPNAENREPAKILRRRNP